MEMVIFIGAQASGKSSFYQERFRDSHVRINLDMLRTRNREAILAKACLRARQSFVVDNTNPTRMGRERYFAIANEHSVCVRGFYFQSSISDCIRRNESRAGGAKVPSRAIVTTIQKMELPTMSEGFDALHFVSLCENNFVVEDWKQ